MTKDAGTVTPSKSPIPTQVGFGPFESRIRSRFSSTWIKLTTNNRSPNRTSHRSNRKKTEGQRTMFLYSPISHCSISSLPDHKPLTISLIDPGAFEIVTLPANAPKNLTVKIVARFFANAHGITNTVKTLIAIT